MSVAKLVANRPLLTVSPPESEDTSSVPTDTVLVWKNCATDAVHIPSGLTLETITNYLREIPCNVSLPDGEESVTSGTVKPVAKGKIHIHI